MTARLRGATPADLDAIMAIETATFPEDAWSSSAMRAELGSQHAWYLVAEDAEADPPIVGYAGLLAPRGTGQADVQTIAVHESARGTGVGRRLLDALLGEAAARGAEEVFLEVRADNPLARGLYERSGFVEIAVRPHYYQPSGVDGVVMRRTARVGGGSGS